MLASLEQTGASLIQRAIPSSGGKHPVVSFGARPELAAAHNESLRAYLDNGENVVDTLYRGPAC